MKNVIFMFFILLSNIFAYDDDGTCTGAVYDTRDTTFFASARDLAKEECVDKTYTLVEDLGYDQDEGKEKYHQIIKMHCTSNQIPDGEGSCTCPTSMNWDTSAQMCVCPSGTEPFSPDQCPPSDSDQPPVCLDPCPSGTTRSPSGSCLDACHIEFCDSSSGWQTRLPYDKVPDSNGSCVGCDSSYPNADSSDCSVCPPYYELPDGTCSNDKCSDYVDENGSTFPFYYPISETSKFLVVGSDTYCYSADGYPNDTGTGDNSGSSGDNNDTGSGDGSGSTGDNNDSGSGSSGGSGGSGSGSS